MDDAQAFLNVLGGKMTNLFCARSDGNAISRHTSSSACCNGRRRQPLEVRNDLLPPAADQVHTIRLQSRDSGQAHAASGSVSVSARYHESNMHRLEEHAKPSRLLDQPQRQLVLRDPTRRLQAEPHREMPQASPNAR